MHSKESGRRRFLKKSVALAGLAVGAARSGIAQTPTHEPTAGRPEKLRAYGEPSEFATAARKAYVGNGAHHPNGYVTPLQEQAGIITPSGLHFWEDHGYALSRIHPREHRLLVHGLVDRPRIYTIEELKRLPSVSRIHFVECNANSRPLRGLEADSVQQVHGKSSCSEWTGVLLSVLLQESGLQQEGRWVVAEGADAGKYTKSIPMEKAMEDTLVAYAQNGEPVRPEQGFPLRLVVPGWEGINCTKWLRRVKVVDQPYMAKWESASNGNVTRDGKGQWFQFEMGAKSVITRPSGGDRLPGPGFYEISGLAWSGGSAVSKVEVSTDGGHAWKEAQLLGPVLPKAHTRFTFPWNWDGQEAVIMSRCSDARGEVQPDLAEFAKLWGFEPSYFRSPESRFDHFNAIQPWKVNRDGSIRNALFS